jgi:hypothetical protein
MVVAEYSAEALPVLNRVMGSDRESHSYFSGDRASALLAASSGPKALNAGDRRDFRVSSD